MHRLIIGEHLATDHCAALSEHASGCRISLFQHSAQVTSRAGWSRQINLASDRVCQSPIEQDLHSTSRVPFAVVARRANVNRLGWGKLPV
jgi:hypothetical protein